MFLCEFSNASRGSYAQRNVQSKSEDYLKNMKVIKEGLESFTADILGKIVEDSDANKNLVVSPISIYSALTMVGIGYKVVSY